MWKMYGESGAAIRTSVASLEKALQTEQRPWLVSGIKYLDRNDGVSSEIEWGSPEIHPWVRRPFLVKRIEYQHESEVRLVTVSFGKSSGIPLRNVNPKDWIQEIAFWPGFLPSESKALEEAVRKISPDVSKMTRGSKLFQRDPTSTFEDAEAAVDDLFATAQSQNAHNYPEFMLQP